MKSIVVATPDVIGARMAGPGIRAWHLAVSFSSLAQVRLVGRWNGAARPSNVDCIEWGSPDASDALRRADVVIGQPHRKLLGQRSSGFRVYDLFDPVVLELDELYRDQPRLRQRLHQRLEWARLERGLDEGDLLVAATPRQRDFYWGIQRSRSVIRAEWIDRWLIVPFGVEQALEAEATDPPRIVWGGGVWGWLDPELAIDAVRDLHRTTGARLVFAGGMRPGGDAASPRIRFLRRHAQGAGSAVEWIDEWLPYEERWRVLSGARIALALHRRTVEAEFSIRIRLFDAIGAGVPIVASRGGFVADLVDRHELGLVVEPDDQKAVTDALSRLILDDEFHARCSRNLRSIAPELSWTRVTQPLVKRVGEAVGW